MRYQKKQVIIFLFVILFGTILNFAQTSENDAQAAIARKDFKQAKIIYTKLAAEHPENLTFILWVARLSAWIGDYKNALKIYDEVLQKNPGNNEALLGKTYVLMWQKKYGKAKEVLDLAEKNGRYDPAFLVAKINFYRYQNKLKEAREFVKIANETNSENVEIKQLEKTLEKAKPKTYKVGCEQNFEPFTATTTACFVNLNIQEGANNLTLKAQSGNRFGKLYRDFGMSWRREINDKLSVTVNASLEPKKNINLDTSVGANYKVNKRLNVGADFRFWRFNNKTINIFSTNLAYSINDKTQVQATLYKSSNNVLLTSLNRQITKPLSVGFSYLKTFETKKTDTFNFSQNAFVVSGKYQISKNLSISGSYGLSQKGEENYNKIYGFGFTFTK